jgi:hypothetical protein
MDTPRRVPGARRLSVPAIHTIRPLTPRTRSAIVRRRRQPLSRAALKSLAPLNLDIPASSLSVAPPNHPEPAPETSLYLVVLNHLADLEARLHTSSSALELLHSLRDEVAAFFPCLDDPDTLPSDPSSFKPTTLDLECDFEYDFGLGAAFDFPFDLNLASALDLDLDLNIRARYAELSNLSLEEAKNKLVALSTLGYDDAKSRFGALGVRLEDAKNRLRKWADETVPTLPAMPTMPSLSAMPALPIPDLPALPLLDLHARLAELRAALPADLSSATDRLVSFVENLIEDDADGDVSWVDTRWKGLKSGDDKGKEKTVEMDMHKVAVRLSKGGTRLIRYCDLPEKWRNNEFVTKGYR